MGRPPLKTRVAGRAWGGHCTNYVVRQGTNLTMEETNMKDWSNGAVDDIEHVVNNHPRTTWVVSPPDEFHPFMGQCLNLGLAKICAPKAAEIHLMLLELRKL